MRIKPKFETNLSDYRGYYDLMRQYEKLIGKTVEIVRTKSRQGIDDVYLHCLGKIDCITDRLIVVKRSDLKGGDKSNYRQTMTYTISDFLTDTYQLTVVD